MNLILLGINHKTAPIELRERLAIPRERLVELTRHLCSLSGIREAMILSTCNRVEILAAAESADARLDGFFADQFAIDSAELAPHLYQFHEIAAVRHLFRVASSLDSMVIGESQILGQVKDAFAAAREAGAIGTELDPLLQSAFAAAKKVRSETEIGSTTVSIASVAVDLARKIFGSLHGKTIFLVGAGKMSELAARHLVAQGASSILLTNRTQSRAETVAARLVGSVRPRVVAWDHLHDAASQADIVITSTGSPHPIFTRDHAQSFLHKRRNRPMFFIDIAVPRDVEAAVNRLEGIFLYDIDDLQSVAAAHLAERTREASDAEAIVAAEVDRYQQRQRTVDIAPILVALQHRAEELRQSELRRMHARLASLTSEQSSAIDALCRSMVNKLLHPTLLALKQAARANDSERIAAIRAEWSLHELETQPDTKPEVLPEMQPETHSAVVPADRKDEDSAAEFASTPTRGRS